MQKIEECQIKELENLALQKEIQTLKERIEEMQRESNRGVDTRLLFEGRIEMKEGEILSLKED